jgi:hypothetical protein
MPQAVESLEHLSIMLVSTGSPENIAHMNHQTEIMRIQGFEDQAILNFLPDVIRSVA